MSERRAPFVPNPVLGGLLGICPLVAAANTLANGLVLGVGAALSVALLALALPSIYAFVPDRLRAPSSLALSAAFALLIGTAVEAFSPVTARGLGVYLPLLAVNCVSLQALRRGPPNSDHGNLDGARRIGNASLLVEALGYAAAATLIGALRELAGAGTLSFPLPAGQSFLLSLADESPAPLFAAPAGGFILLGSLAALYRIATRGRGRKKA